MTGTSHLDPCRGVGRGDPWRAKLRRESLPGNQDGDRKQGGAVGSGAGLYCDQGSPVLRNC